MLFGKTRFLQSFVSQSPSASYLFISVALLFGLPLLTAYYDVNPTFYVWALVPYLVATVSVAIFLIFRSQRRVLLRTNSFVTSMTDNRRIAKFSSLPSYFLSGLVGLTA